jgi:hypothetical protein
MLEKLLAAIDWSSMERRQNHDKDGNLVDKHYLSYHIVKPDVEFDRNGEKLSATKLEITILARNVAPAEQRAARKAAATTKGAVTNLKKSADDELEAAIADLQKTLAARKAQ